MGDDTATGSFPFVFSVVSFKAAVRKRIQRVAAFAMLYMIPQATLRTLSEHRPGRIHVVKAFF